MESFWQKFLEIQWINDEKSVGTLYKNQWLSPMKKHNNNLQLSIAGQDVGLSLRLTWDILSLTLLSSTI